MEHDHVIDKRTWGPGAWQDEPDRVEWRAHGLPCLLVRSDSTGAWCGYVGLLPEHPWRTRDDLDLGDFDDLDVPGGVTYVDKCAGPICHVPKEGESDDVLWVGFDHGHCFDFMPAIAALMSELGRQAFRGARYTTEAKARLEVEHAAAQAAAAYSAAASSSPRSRS